MGHGGDIKYDQTPSAVCVVLCPFVVLCVVGVEIVSFCGVIHSPLWFSVNHVHSITLIFAKLGAGVGHDGTTCGDWGWSLCLV